MKQIKFLWNHTTCKKKIVILIFLSFFVGVLNACFSYSIGYAIQMSTFTDKQNYILIFLFIVFIGLLRSSFQYLFNNYSQKIKLQMEFEYRSTIVKSLLKKDFLTLQNSRSGDLLNRIQTSLNNIPNLLQQLVELISYSLILIIFFGTLFYIDWRILLTFLVIIPIFILLQKKLINLSQLYTLYLKERAMLDAYTLDMLFHRTTIKSYGIYQYFNKRLIKMLSIQRKSGMHAAYHVLGVGSLPEAVNSLGNILLCVVVIFLYRAENMSASMLISILLLAQMSTSHLTDLTGISINLPVNIAYVDVLKEIMDMPENKSGNCQEKKIGVPAIELKNITYIYNQNETQPLAMQENCVLKNISLSILEGERVAVVGKSGSGKSTLLKVISGLYNTQDGTVSIFGVLVKDWDIKSLTSYMTIVSQDPFLFNMSILENIRCVKPTATDYEIQQAVEMASLLPFIQSLPNGWDTVIGEQGVNLSGGQRQRITIARTFLIKPQILLLDEATSALDAKTEQDIYDTLSMLMKGKTQLIVAHKLSAIKNVDRIIVMDKGEIVEEGKHDVLLLKQGIYTALWEKQRKEIKL